MGVRSCRSIGAAECVPEAAAERYRTLKSYEKLRAAETSEGGALEPVGISRRTRYGWQAQAAAQLPEGAACAALATRWKWWQYRALESGGGVM